jgi:iron complex transport system permease protein
MSRLPYHRRRLTRARLAVLLVGTFAILLIVALLCLFVGPEGFSAYGMSVLVGGGDDAARTILLSLRLPRILLAISVGGALGATGVVFQALLRNPLAEPYILGVSNGCAVGAILGYLIGAGAVLLPMMSFVGGAISVVAVLAVSRGTYGFRSESMLLGGVMVAAIAAAAIFLLLGFLGDAMRSAVQWMLGDLGNATGDIGYGSMGLFVAVLAAGLFSGDLLNAVALGDDEAMSLGVAIGRVRVAAYLIASLVVGVAVAFCGAIGFVGLVVPHIIRRTVGPDHRVLLPISVIGGGLFLLVCDTVARSLMGTLGSAATELPVGAITALLGAPLFIYLLRRGASTF